MAASYVRKTGSDANNGLTAGAAKLTIAAGVAAGSPCYVGAGTYAEKNDFSALTGNSLIGDVYGTNTGDPGQVIVTGWDNGYGALATNNNDTLKVGADWTIKHLTIVHGSLGRVGNSFALKVTAASYATGLVLEDCELIGYEDNLCLYIDQTAGTTSMKARIKRCYFNCLAEAVKVVQTQTTAGGFDLDVILENCVFVMMDGGGNTDCCLRVSGGDFGAAGTGCGGVIMRHCTWIAGDGSIIKAEFTSPSSFPSLVKYGLHYGAPANATGAFNALAAGQITEDWNVVTGNLGKAVPAGMYKNVTAGANTKYQGEFMVALNFGAERLHRLRPRNPFEPLAGSPAIRFVTDGTDPVTEDIFGNPRPPTSVGLTAGAIEPKRGWVKETGTVHTGSNAISRTGWGWEEFTVAVDAVATTLKVFMRYDGTYTGTRPQFQVLHGAECGVADATVTATVAALNAWEEQSLTFTPTAKGLVTVRVLSNDTNGAGKAFADTRTGW